MAFGIKATVSTQTNKHIRTKELLTARKRKVREKKSGPQPRFSVL